ncbi:hypothetical protein Gotri_022575 [Gossypium trilobum]|uniref:BRCT domain-containing protein n=1 Tax=Gossypium trilobum TaxID=34281 RepID=A0A7J9DGF6_9ROSI|nr:hypothetical protein [Gossypium trilobum]
MSSASMLYSPLIPSTVSFYLFLDLIFIHYIAIPDTQNSLSLFSVCILKSMKSGSDCPVCKVPCRRREVRPAPHMDNLVSIYKSMEVASGFNIFVTQDAPLDTSADSGKRVKNDLNCCERMDNQGANKGRGSREAKSTETSDPISVKPSFPTNKRVQVPQYPLSETSMLPEKNGGGLIEITEDESKMSSDILKENNLGEKGEQILSPFFWLREEDVERPSQLSDGDQCLYITPPGLPSFSDMKDSDDEGFSKEEVHGNRDHLNLFDSEMFEWTQGACSPELLPSPDKMQVADTYEPASQGASTAEPCNNGTCMITGHDASEEMLPNIESLRIQCVSGNKIRSCKSKELGKKQRKTAQKNIADRTSSHISGDHVNLGKGSEDFNKKQKDDCSSSSYLAKTRKNCKVAGLDHHVTEPMASHFSAKAPKQEDTPLAAIVGMGKCGDENENLRVVKRCRKITAQCQNKSCSKLKKQKLSLVKVDTPKEVLTVCGQTNEYMIQQKSSLPVPLAHENAAEQFRKGLSKHTREVKLAPTLKSEKNSGCKKKIKVSFSDDMKSGLPEDQQQQGGNVSLERVSEKVHGRTTVGISESSMVKKLPLANGVALHKCETITIKIQCAFCLSMEETEAINLEAELSRSRKIKCSCCGLKGAALGCYEKSCRKSFHVPCAKLVSQCRWDADNFVILCPLHASSKLPNEKSESQGIRKRRNLRGQLLIHHNEIPINDEVSVQKKWNPCESRNKLVLCCSGLTVEEKEIMSEFEKLAGVTVLKRWDSNITHIIASTDENGACKRTLKILMGILEGKWILNIKWVKACIKAMKLVDELKYEITIDVHGIRDGPRLGRLRLQNKQPKLFDGCKFYIMGDFEPSYKGDLQDVLIAAGGTILHRKPISGDPGARLLGSPAFPIFIIYSVELPVKCDPSKKHMILSRRQLNAEALASSTGAKAVSNSWVLSSISACKLLSFGE